jgi:hypothetical protein
MRLRRRTIELISAAVGVAALALILYNATVVDRKPPTLDRVRLSSPAVGEQTGQVLTTIDLDFSEPVDHASVEGRFHISPYVAGTISWDQDRTAIFTPGKKLPSSTSFSVELDPGFRDLAGNAAPTGLSAWQFTTVGPPTVVSAAPSRGSAGVAVSTSVVLTFDRLMDTTSVETALIVAPDVPYRESWSGQALTIVFGGPLRFGTSYSVSVGPGATDTDGVGLAQPYQTAFVTVSSGLGIERVMPADGVSGVSVRAPIGLIFDASIDPSSIGVGLRITPPVAGTIAIADLPLDEPTVPAVSPSPSGTTGQAPGSSAGAAPSASNQPAPSSGTSANRLLTFVPSAPLAPHTTYTVTLDPVIRRADDPTRVADGRSWTFTTGNPSTSAQNQVAFLSARSGVPAVWLMNPDGSNPRQVTAEVNAVSAYAFAADGQSLVFASGGVIKRMKTDGSDLTTLTQPGRFEYAPVLAPDGRSYVVGRDDASGADLGYWQVLLPGVAGNERQLLASGAPPPGVVDAFDPGGAAVTPERRLSADGLVTSPGTSAWGSRAAFDATGRYLLLAETTGRLHLIDLGPTTDAPPIELPAPGLVGLGLPASLAGPPGSFLVVAHAGSEDDSLWQIRPDGSASRLFAAIGAVSGGRLGVVASLTQSGAGPAHLTEQAGLAASPSVLTTATDLADRSPVFSPDGTTLIFARVQAGQPDRSAGIWLVGLDGRELRQLTTDGSNPAWLP